MIYRVEVMCEWLTSRKKLGRKRRYFLVDATSARDAMRSGDKIAEDMTPIGQDSRSFTCLSAFPVTLPVECGPI